MGKLLVTQAMTRKSLSMVFPRVSQRHTENTVLTPNFRITALMTFTDRESQTEAGSATMAPQLTHLLEWRYGGHRLAYVSAIARAAAGSGSKLVLVTTSTVAASAEYTAHLADLERRGIVGLRIADEISTCRGKLSMLRRIRRAGLGVVVPEADTVLPVLLLAALVGSLPRPTATILMRPPRWRQGGLRSVARGTLKVALISICRLMRRSFDLHLLDDPLAEKADRIWHTPLSGSAFRLDDPCDLFGSSVGALPAELAGRISDDDQLLTVLGSIDGRKRIPLIIDAWLHSERPHNAKLLIAGHHERDVIPRLRRAEVAGDPTIITVDRYLDNGEMGAVLKRSSGIFILYDGGLSSGLLVTTASVGRWVIALEGSRTGRVAAGRGLAELCPNSVPGVAVAIQNVLQRSQSPSPVLLGNSLDFGRRVLRRLTVSTGQSVR